MLETQEGNDHLLHAFSKIIWSIKYFVSCTYTKQDSVVFLLRAPKPQ